MSLALDVRLARGALTLDAALDAADGETVAILGPNGAGKTTLLRTIAGLAPIDAGRIELDGAVLDDGTAFVVPERRPVGVVFQDALLFPHLTVLENVAFGLRARGADRATSRRIATDALGGAGLDTRARSKPRELSGGETQRIALVRALVTEPRLLLLDEPLAALDQSARNTVRRELRADLARFPGVRLLVTHDPVDAAALADRLVILEHGRVVQQGTFAEVSARPRSPYVAELVGVNLLHGECAEGHVQLATGGDLVVATPVAGAVFVIVHPRAVALHRERPTGSPRNVATGPVESIELLGDRVRVRVGGPVPLIAEVTPAAVAELGLVVGRTVWTAVKATEIGVYPR